MGKTTAESGITHTHAAQMLDLIVSSLRRYAYRYTSEADLQAGVHAGVVAAGYHAVREHDLGPLGRLDLYVPALRVAIEVKVAGGANEVMRQIAGYATHPDVDGVVLVTTRPARHRMPATLGGKPVAVFGVVAL